MNDTVSFEKLRQLETITTTYKSMRNKMKDIFLNN